MSQLEIQNDCPSMLDLHLFLEPDSHFPPDIQFRVISPTLGTSTLLPAHMVFLAEASPVFKRQFYGGFFRPTKEKELKITDVEPDVFKHFLDLIYGARDILWTGSDELGLENLFELLKLIDYHVHDGQHKPLGLLKGRVMKVFAKVTITDNDLENYIEIADKYNFLEEAHTIIIDKSFESKCLQQFGTIEFDDRLVAIARDINPRWRPKPLFLMSKEERISLSKTLPQAASALPSRLATFHETILCVTQHIQAEKDKHVSFKRVVVEIEKDVVIEEDIAEPVPKSPVEIQKWHILDGKWKITPAYAEMEEKAKTERQKAEVAHRSNVPSVLEGSRDRTIPDNPVIQYRGRLGTLIHFSVRSKPEGAKDQYEMVADIIMDKFDGKRGVIFTTVKKDAEALVVELRQRGVTAGVGGTRDTRKDMFSWLGGKTRVIVACSLGRFQACDQDLWDRASTTTVSFVMHLGLPFSIKDFFKEVSVLSENIPTKSIMFWRLGDYSKVSGMAKDYEDSCTASLHSLVSYCLEVNTCRVFLLGKHLQDMPDQDRCGDRCDNCQASQGEDMTEQAKDVIRVLRLAKEKNKKVTMRQVVDCLLGKGLPELRLEDWQRSTRSREQVEALVAKLVVDKYIWEQLETNIYRTVSYIEAADREVVGTIRMKFRESKPVRKRAMVARGKAEPKIKRGKKRVDVYDEDEEDVEDDADDLDFM